MTDLKESLQKIIDAHAIVVFASGSCLYMNTIVTVMPLNLNKVLPILR